MTKITIDKDTAKETLVLLSYFDSSFVDNIPNSIFEELTNIAADSTKNFYINKDKSLSEQEISPQCKNVISTIYKYIEETSSNKRR